MSELQRTVLIVDDREENRYTTGHALKRSGFAIIEAATGQQALEMSKLMPDVIILDVRLPDMLGYEACRRLRSNPRTSHIPILQLSATFLNTESKLYALESGADAYLAQPADPLVLVATVRSLLRLHDAERKAKAAAEQWTATFDALSEGVAIVSGDVIQRCNRAMTELLHTSYTVIEQTGYSELLREHFGTEVDSFAGSRHIHVQKGSRFFQLSMASFADNEDSAGSVLIAADVTPQKQTEQALLLNERLAATGRMAHTIAHEINNPLEAITNLIYLTRLAPDLPPHCQEYLDAASHEVQRVSQITRQILSFHREATVPVAIPIAELLQDVLALSNREIEERQLKLVLDLDPALMVNGYPARLRQAFSNIIRNAIEVSPPSGILRLRISPAVLHHTGKPIDAVRITLADRGAGIPLEYRDRIFEAFFTTKEQKGSGIGLWLTATIVHEHGGRLQIRSCTHPGRSGTSMSILLPLRASDRAKDNDAADRKPENA